MIRGRLPVALAGIAGALAIAACGSSSKPSQSAGAPQALKFAACMRSHGVPNFPDPSGGGGGIQIPVGSGISPFSPAFKAAQQDCHTLLPGGGAPPSPATAEQKARLFQLAQCMREHGVSDFPDPTSSPPSNPAGFRLAFGRPGAFIAVPSTIDPQPPSFKQAAKACRFPGA